MTGGQGTPPHDTMQRSKSSTDVDDQASLELLLYLSSTMPTAVHNSPPDLPQWKRPAKTTESLPWADISIIDISTFEEPGAKEKLAEQLRNAVQTTGFFSVTGTGFTEEEVTRQYAIGQEYFNLPLEQKNLPDLRCDFGNGNYFGYRAVRETLNEMDETRN